MKKLLITLYTKIHKPVNHFIVFLVNFLACFPNRCKEYLKRIKLYEKALTRILQTESYTQFINQLVTFYLNTTREFQWTPDYLGGIVNIIPDALMFLRSRERDDCDGPAGFFMDLLKNTAKASHPKKGIEVEMCTLYTDDPIFSAIFWKRLHVVIIIDNSIVLSNGTAYYADYYFKQTPYKPDYKVRYDYVKL